MTNDLPATIKLAIVDDHNLFRKGLIKLINLGDKDQKYKVLFEADNGHDMKEKLDRLHLPDIILMDINMPDMDGYETVEWLKRHFPDINIIIVSMFETQEAILRMLKLGVKGYLSKHIEVEDMHQALESVASKGYYYSEMVTVVMADNLHSKQAGNLEDVAGQGPAGKDKMTENERTFLQWACSELTYVEIADKMHLSPKTIEGYREALFTRFKTRNRVGLVIYALQNGLVKLEQNRS